MYKQIKIALIIASLILTGCASTQRGQPIDTTNLNQIEAVSANNVSGGSTVNITSLRAQAVREAGTSLGAQAGLAWQAQQFNEVVNKNQANLDKTFNFRELLIDNKVQPPVLDQGSQLVNLADTSTIRVADKTYRIVSQAQFVTTPANWRSYLMMNYSKPSLPDRTLLPKNKTEQRIWSQAVKAGWKQGIDQAKSIYLDNLGRLQRDYNGMLLYRTLLQQNMVSKPYVAETDLGVTNNGDNSQMYINDKVLRITALPQLNPNSKKWHPVLTP